MTAASSTAVKLASLTFWTIHIRRKKALFDKPARRLGRSPSISPVWDTSWSNNGNVKTRNARDALCRATWWKTPTRLPSSRPWGLANSSDSSNAAFRHRTIPNQSLSSSLQCSKTPRYRAKMLATSCGLIVKLCPQTPLEMISLKTLRLEVQDQAVEET